MISEMLFKRLSLGRLFGGDGRGNACDSDKHSFEMW